NPSSVSDGGRNIVRGHACRKIKADLCDLTHVGLSFLNVALTKSSESRSLRLQHHAEVKRWSCSFRPWCRRAHRRRPGGPPGTQFRDSTALHRRLQGPFFIGSQEAICSEVVAFWRDEASSHFCARSRHAKRSFSVLPSRANRKHFSASLPYSLEVAMGCALPRMA